MANGFEKHIARTVRNFPNIHENEVVPISVTIYVSRQTGKITAWGDPKPCRLHGQNLTLIDSREKNE